MTGLRKVIGQTLRVVAGSLWSFVLWTLWLGLALLAAGQIYIAATNEVAVPGIVLDRLQGRLNQTGIRVAFDRATFDPTGRILVHSPQVFLADLGDPIITARAAYIGLDPWALLIGKVDAREVRLMGATVSVPAILSDSGRTEAIVHDLDGFLIPAPKQLVVRHLTGRLGTLAVSVHGAITLGRSSEQTSANPVALIRAHFHDFCRTATEVVRRLDSFDQPSLEIELEPTGTRGAVVSAVAMARAMNLSAPVNLQASKVRATLRVPVLGEAALSRLDFSADSLRLPQAITARGVTASIQMPLQIERPALGRIDGYISATAIEKDNVAVEHVSATVQTGAGVLWQASVVGRVLGAPIAVKGEVDLKAKTATVQCRGAIAPKVIDVISARTHVNVGQFFSFAALDCERGTARFGPDWKFAGATARVALRGIAAHGVQMDEGTAELEVDSRHLYSPNAFARIGANYARGSYEHEFASRQFRFLLDGALRPLDIGEWFHSWWPNFFQRAEFPVVPPQASVDVSGFWREGRRTSVFVFADAKEPVVMGQKLERLRTRLFIRPGFYDGFELYATDTRGEATGVFTVTSDVASAQWRSIDVSAQSTLAFSIGAGIAQALHSSVLSSFELEQPPVVQLRAHFDGPAIDGPRHQSVDLEAHMSGGFRFFKFPLRDVGFTSRFRDDEITIDQVEGGFAGGKVRGHAKVWTEGGDRRLGFDAAVTDASLGLAVTALQNFAADRKGQPHPAPGKFVQEKANVRIDVAASADGSMTNIMSYHGNGNTSLRGAEIGEVALFGPLSELLKFTALRFTTAQADFKINGSKLEFPRVALRGANSAIDAHGQYALDRRDLDFRAKIFPFEESGSVLKSVVGAVLTPISNVLEVKLTGSLEKPDWAFVIGPTNFLRSLAPSQPEPPPAIEKPVAEAQKPVESTETQK